MSLESERAINHRPVNIDWQINPEIGAIILRSDHPSQSEKMIAVGGIGEENRSFSITIDLPLDQPPFSDSHFHGWSRSKGEEKRGRGDSTTN